MFSLCLAAMLSTASAASASPSSPRNPVLLIHGINDDGRNMERMARHLRAGGWSVSTMSLKPNRGQVGLDELATQITVHAEQTFAKGAKFDLVGFSMGGLVCRYYLQRLGGMDRVERFVTISTPHRGTWMAHLLLNAACRQMRPGSAFLRDLSPDAAGMLKGVRFTSIWTPLDLTIIPARSSEIPGARNVRLWVALHPLMVLEPRCLRAVTHALEA